MKNHPLPAFLLVVVSLTLSSWSAVGEVLTLTNQSFEDNGIGAGDFLNAAPTGWVRIVPSGRTVGLIGEDRTVVANTSAGITWAHLQTDSSAPANPPGIGQAIGTLADSAFSDISKPKLWVHCIASRRLNETSTIHVTASLYAAPIGASDWTSGTLIDSAVISTNLSNLIDGDSGSTTNLALMLDLDNTTAQSAHPGGNYWIVLSNTMSSAGQLHLDWVNAQTGNTTDPGPVDPPSDPPISPADLVDGDLILFNDNGGWCWYQDERIIIDRDNDNIVISSGANYVGYGGEPRDGDLDITTFQHATGARTMVTLSNIPTLNKGDDHNVPAIWQRPDGRYFAKYTGHLYGNGTNFGGDIPKSFYRTTTLANDGAAWDLEQSFTWPENDTVSPINGDVTYTNLFFMSSEGTGQGRLYNIARAADRTPNIAYSDDQGVTWNYGGKLSVASTSGGGNYSNGYFVFNGNGVDRIDFMCTEHHPRDYNNSIYHGYIQGGKSYDSLGNVIDSNIFDEVAPAPQAFTQVWATSSVTSSSYHHGWTVELERVGGNLYGLFVTRYGNVQSTERTGDAAHRLFYTRFNGSAWVNTELCQMGDSLDGYEGDYTGLGTIHPNDASTIYVSAEHDPRDDTPLAKHEIFKGVTSDQGANWTWTAITENSTVENLRPIVPKWHDGEHTALLWLRGRYDFQRDYDQSVVGMILRPDEQAGLVSYSDANTSNTTLADGSPFTPTGPTDVDGAADAQWHQHTGLGNGATAFTSSDTNIEDAPAIKTSITGLVDGTYDVYAYFWSKPSDDWRIRAGFSSSDLLVFRRYSCQQAEAGQFDAQVAVSDSSQALYRAYVGRRTVSGGSAIDVFLDDFDGASSGSERTVYDGLGVARVLPILHVAVGETVTVSAADGPYASIHNEGTLIIKGSSDLVTSGSLINDGFLDVFSYTGLLPAGLINNGSLLNISNAELKATITLQANSNTITLGGYAGHSYQLQSSTSLLPNSWQDVGTPVAGSGVNGTTSPIAIQQPNSETSLFYRFVID